MTRLGVALGAHRGDLRQASPASATWCSPAPTTSRATAASGRTGAAARARKPRWRRSASGRGLPAARAVLRAVAARVGVSMPIVEGLYRTLFESVPAREVVRADDTADQV